MIRAIAIGAGVLSLLAGTALAEDIDIAAGKVEFLSACAGCHGRDAKGDGPMATLLKVSTPDLTKLTERAGGTFPFRNTLLLIDGREVRAHGGEMPIWGDRYMTMAIREEDAVRPPRVPGDPEPVVTARLVSLVGYLASIQE